MIILVYNWIYVFLTIICKFYLWALTVAYRFVRIEIA